MTNNQGEPRVDSDQGRSGPDAAVPTLVDQELSGVVIGVFFDSFNSLLPDHLESVYCKSMARRLRKRGFNVKREARVGVWDDGECIGYFKADLLVEDRLVVEVKAGPVLDPRASKQIKNYLRCSDLQLGLLLHFGDKPRFHRFYNPYNSNRVPTGGR
jgi:GxxExxY protein